MRDCSTTYSRLLQECVDDATELRERLCTDDALPVDLKHRPGYDSRFFGQCVLRDKWNTIGVFLHATRKCPGVDVDILGNLLERTSHVFGHVQGPLIGIDGTAHGEVALLFTGTGGSVGREECVLAGL